MRCWSSAGYKRNDFLGVDTMRMGPHAQVAVALLVLAPVVLSALFLVLFAPDLWWISTTYGWVAFPALGLLARGLSGIAAAPSRKQRTHDLAKRKEQELLETLEYHGEITPTQAAMETSLSVVEATRMLEDLSREGHLEVRARGGGLFYALWDPDNSVEDRRAALE